MNTPGAHQPDILLDVFEKLILYSPPVKIATDLY